MGNDERVLRYLHGAKLAIVVYMTFSCVNPPYHCQVESNEARLNYQVMKTESKFYNINHIVNANATKLVDETGWINWSLARLKSGISKRNVNRIAELITE